MNILKGPTLCKCGNNIFKKQKDVSYNTSGINSFFEQFSKITLKVCLKVIICMLVYNLNAKKIFDMIKNTLKENIKI